MMNPNDRLAGLLAVPRAMRKGSPMIESMSRRKVLAGGLFALAFAGPSLAVAEQSDEGSLADTVAALAPCPVNLEESQLDDAVAAYAYDGVSCEVTARMVIEDATNIEQRKNDDGTYSAPSAEDILTYVRNEILRELVRANNVEVSDDEVLSYMQSTLGAQDYSTVANYYGLDEDKAKTIITEGAAVAKLRDTVTYSIGAAPQMPTAPEDGDSTASNADYAAYIVGLAGSDWNADTKTWADGSAYGQALAQYDFNGETANYEMAFAAYNVASQAYGQASSQQYSAWQEYTNEYFSKATLMLLSLKA